MAEMSLLSPFDYMKGKMRKHEGVVYRTRNGRTHSYVLDNPYTGPLAESRKAAIRLLSEASRRCAADFADPERLAYWKEQYKQHLQKAKKLSPLSKKKVYGTLRGFVIAAISAQLKANPNEPSLQEGSAQGGKDN